MKCRNPNENKSPRGINYKNNIHNMKYSLPRKSITSLANPAMGWAVKSKQAPGRDGGEKSQMSIYLTIDSN